MDAVGASYFEGKIELWADLSLFFGGPLQEQYKSSLYFFGRKNTNYSKSRHIIS